MEYTTLRKPPKPKPPKSGRQSPLPPPQRPTGPQDRAHQRKCPSGFRWDRKKGRCVQAGVGPEYRP